MTKDREDNTPKDEVTLRMKLDDILGVVTKSGRGRVLSQDSFNDTDSEDIKKAWFRHMLKSMERLSDLVESVRSVDISNLKSDLKDEIKRVEKRLEGLGQQVIDNRKEVLANANKIDTDLTGKLDRSHQDLLKRIEDLVRDLNSYKLVVDSKFNTFDKELDKYKRAVVDPLSMKVMAISVKLGVWGTVAGLIGGAIFTVAWFFVKTYIFAGQ
jgi:archaellum component FlaC